MSEDLYPTMLRWDGHHGVAKLAGRRVELTAAPRLSEGVVWAIDYRPEVSLCEIQTRCTERKRDMEPHEIDDAETYLRLAVATQARTD